MLHQFSRTELLIGPEALERLKGKRVAVFGAGGVGSFAIEALARAGVGRLTIVDFDVVCISNVNRQLHAMTDTVGRPKVELMAERIRRINPDCEVAAHVKFYSHETPELLEGGHDAVLDCIDKVTPKLHLLASAHAGGARVYSAMGAANKLDPRRVRLGDISETTNCPFARDVRRELKSKYGIASGITVVYSTEQAHKPFKRVADVMNEGVPAEKINPIVQLNGTIAYMPSLFGLMLAGAALQDLMAEEA